MYQEPVCEGGYGALNCKKSKAEYIGVTSEPRLSSMAGKTLKHISYFKYLGSKILDSIKSQVCKVLAWSVCNKLAPFVAQVNFSAVELILMYNSKKLNNKCLAAKEAKLKMDAILTFFLDFKTHLRRSTFPT